jgi:hypothetical protein
MVIILATWEADIQRFTVGGQSGQKIRKTPSQPTAGHRWRPLVISSYAGGGQIMVPGQPRQLRLQDPISMEKSWEWGCAPVILAMAGSIKQEDGGPG